GTASPAWRSAILTLASAMHVRSPGSCSRMRPRSEPLGKSRHLQRVRTVRPRYLAAQAGSREELAGVRQTGRIECRAQPLHRVEVVFAEHERHRAGLVGADAVLAGDRAA